LVYDGDQDGDGLTDYEDGLLGFDANTPNSTGSELNQESFSFIAMPSRSGLLPKNFVTVTCNP